MSKNKRKAVSTAQTAKNSGYSGGGASMDKNALREWRPQHYSSKIDLDLNLDILRDRTADLALNSPLGAAAINAMTLGVLSSGLKLFPKPKFKDLGLTAEQAREWSRKTKLEFDLWANDLHCDYYRRNNFYEIQQILFTSYLIDGDSFCLFRRRYPANDRPYSLRLQALEAQRVSNPQIPEKGAGLALSPIEMQGTRKGSKIVRGVEVDRNGRLLAIWVSNRIWNEPLSLDAETTWKRVKIFGDETGCKNVLMMCRDTRAEQFRGAPLLAPVIETLKQVMRYADSELVASIIKSFFSIFFVQPLGSNLDFNDILPEEERGRPVVDVADYRLGSGTISALPRGIDVKAIDRSNAQSNFDPFVTAFVKFIGAAVGIPYEILLKNFQASYSASKAALTQAEDTFRQYRAAFVQDFCQPVYEMFLSEAVALGRIKAPGFFKDPMKRFLWCGGEWRTEASHLLDAEKEVAAAQLRIQLGLSTRAKEAAELCGTDFDENAETLLIENKIMEKVNPQPEEETDNGKRADD